jgi:tyrosine-protein kinase Etk/Wzc
MKSNIGRGALDHDQSGDVEVSALLDMLIIEWRRIAVTVIAVVLLACAYLVITRPVYQASILVQVEDNVDSSAKSLLGDISSLFDVKSSSDAEIQILGSMMIVGGTVDNLALYVEAQPRYFPLIGRFVARHNDSLSTPGLFGWGGFAWGDEAITVKTFDVPRKFEDDSFTLVNLGDGKYRLKGEDLPDPVEGQVGRTEFFTTPKGPIALFVKDIVGNPGVAFTLKRHARLKTISNLQDALNIAEQGKDSGVISVVLKQTDASRVTRIVNEIGRLYVKQNVERKSEEAGKSLEFLNAQVPVFKHQLEEAEQRYNEARMRTGTLDLDAEAKLVLQQATDIESRRLQLVQQRKALSVDFASSHPEVAVLDAQIAELSEQGKQIQQRIRTLPETEQGIVRLMRDVQVDTSLYTALLDNVEQLRLLKAGKVGNVRLIDNGVVPDDPVRPKASIVIPVAVVAGLVLGIVLVLVRESLFNGVTDPNEIESLTGLSVYASVPESRSERRAARLLRAEGTSLPLLAVKHPHDPAVESLRSFRTALQFALLEAKNNVVLFSGPAPSVGKSFVSANFGAVMAAAGKRVLVIDCDLRRGRLHEYFGTGRDGGFSDLVANATSPELAIRKGKTGQPDFIPTGTLPPNPGELLLNERVKALLDRFSETYELVIIDTPPVLAAADTGIIAPLAGAIFLVAMAGFSKIGEIVESEKRIRQSGMQVNGVVFNAIRARSGLYGYGSKYGSYRYVAYSYENKANAS